MYRIPRICRVKISILHRVPGKGRVLIMTTSDCRVPETSVVLTYDETITVGMQ